MPSHKFDELLHKIEDCLIRQNTMMRASIGPSERLAVTLRFLAYGETFSSLEKQFRISRTAISYIVIEVSDHIVLKLDSFLIFNFSFKYSYSHIFETKDINNV